jgi:alpha-L-rhamnosidase
LARSNLAQGVDRDMDEQLIPSGLRCEYRADPLGIDVRRPRLSWVLGSSRRGVVQSAYQVLVAVTLEDLDGHTGGLWDSGKIKSDQSTHIEYAGQDLRSHLRCYWKVRVWDQQGTESSWSEIASWSMGLLDASEWEAAWIGYDAPYRRLLDEARHPGMARKASRSTAPLPFRILKKVLPLWLKMKIKQGLAGPLLPLTNFLFMRQMRRFKPVLIPPSYLRKDFTANRTRRATLYVTALGLYEVHLNGSRVGEDYFTPGWTDYSRRLYYQTYDVTSLMRDGSNALGAILADGWYAGYIGPHGKRGYYGAVPRFLLQLHLDYEDGTSEVVATDPTWKAANGPLLQADLLMGESYDARRERPGWSEPGFNDGDWSPVNPGTSDKPAIRAMPHAPVRRVEEVQPLAVSEPRPGQYVLDLGRNFAGWARLRVEGPEGTKVVLRFGEWLNPDGTLYTENLRSARATDTYILRGGGPEVWEPSFTYHGFQFVEVSGYPGTLDEQAVTGIVVTSTMSESGRFACSDDLINQLHRNIVTTQLANFIEVPTDCPQRDERLGWLGDAQIFMRAAGYNRDIAAFFTKWLADIGDAQSPAGAFPDIAPRVVAEQDGSPGWGDAGVICPWTLYHVYGDRRILEDHYPSMKKWIDYLEEANPDHLWRHRTGNNNGEWLPVDHRTPKDVLATAYYAYSACHVAAAAALLGRDEEATRYRQLFERIKKAFNEAFVASDGRIRGGTQTCYVLALHFDLLPESLRAQAAKYLVADIDRRRGHLSTGFFGTGYLPSVLTAAGHVETAFRILTQDSFPSWGYSIRQGATSIWEHWDGWRDDRGFKPPIMNSFSHYAFGSVDEWLFAAVAGIDTQGPGFRRIVIHPRIGGGLTRVEAQYDAISGRIASAWRIEGDRFDLDVTIPANTRAEVVLPTADLGAIREDRTPIDETDGIASHRLEDGKVILEVGSGDYRFSVSPFTMPP